MILNHNIAFSRQETMTTDGKIPQLINELKDLGKCNIDNIEKIFNSKFSRSVAPKDELDWLVPDTTASTNIFELYASDSYPQIKKATIETHTVGSDFTEFFISVFLKNGMYLNTTSIVNILGDKNQLKTQAANVPDNKRCYIEYTYPDRTLTLGFESCKQLDQVSHFHIRYSR